MGGDRNLRAPDIRSMSSAGVGRPKSRWLKRLQLSILILAGLLVGAVGSAWLTTPTETFYGAGGENHARVTKSGILIGVGVPTKSVPLSAPAIPLYYSGGYGGIAPIKFGAATGSATSIDGVVMVPDGIIQLSQSQCRIYEVSEATRPSGTYCTVDVYLQNNSPLNWSLEAVDQAAYSKSDGGQGYRGTFWMTNQELSTDIKVPARSTYRSKLVVNTSYAFQAKYILLNVVAQNPSLNK